MPLTLTVINEASSRLADRVSHSWHDKGGTVGRADNNDWTLPDPNMEISRCHARIRCQDGRYYLEDTSANGILLADGVSRLDPAEPYPLEDGAEFLIGDYRIRARIAQEDPSPPPVAEAPPPPEVGEGQVVDPLELLGGAVEQSGEPPSPAASESYLNEHFEPPRFREDPPAPRPAGEQGPAEAQDSSPLLPEDWWRDSPAQPATNPSPAAPDPVEQPPAAEPPGVPEPPRTPPQPPQPGQPDPVASPGAEQPPARPSPGGRGSRPSPTPGGAEAPQSTATGSGVPDAALRQLLAGAGLDPDQVPADKAEEVGRILNVAVQGVMDLLRARMEIKNEFRMSVTLIQARENNPLKFSTSTEDAIHNLMVKHNPDYLPAVEAFESGFEDLRFHQLAMLAGMRSGFFEMLRQLDPENLEPRFADGGERSMLGRMTGPKYWEKYKALFSEINRDTEGYFNRLFGEAFSEAYEKEMQRLKAQSAHKGR